MKLLDRLLHRGQEWDARYSQWVRKGWVAERDTTMDAEYETWRRGERRNDGTCLDCGRALNDHPMPERMWRRGGDLCARVGQLPPYGSPEWSAQIAGAGCAPDG